MVTKVAIVGSGFGLYGLLPAFSRISECEVVSICGKKSERLLNDCRVAGVENIYSDWKDMLKKENPDAVAIAVIPKYQYEIAKYALNNGIAVFAEKPLAVSVHDAKELYGLAKETKLPNMVDFLFPEIPEWAAAKKAIEDGLIGRIIGMDVNWNFLSYDIKNGIKSWKTDASQGGGALQFYFSHVFYYLEYFLGRIKKLDCVLSTSKQSLNHGETSVKVNALFENGCVVDAKLDCAYAGKQEHSIEFQGEGGTLLLQNNSNSWMDNFELTLSDKQGTKNLKPGISLPNNSSDDGRVKLVTQIAARFIDWCSNGIPSKPDFQDGLRNQELIEMAKISNLKGGRK